MSTSVTGRFIGVTETSGGTLTMDFPVHGPSAASWPKWIKTLQGSSGAEAAIASMVLVRMIQEPHLE